MSHLTPPADKRPYLLVEADAGETLAALPRETIAEAYRTHGALLLRGFAPDLDAFQAFAARFCTSSVFNESPNRQLLDKAHNIQSVNGGVEAFPLHPELSREPWKPDLCLFFCLGAPSSGGQTTMCDGIALAEAIPANIREALDGRRLVYVQEAGLALLEYWLGTAMPSDAQLASPPAGCPYRFTRRGDRILRSFSRPALHRPMFDTRPAFGNFLLFSHFHNGVKGYPLLDDGTEVPDAWLEAIRDAGERLSVPVGWQAGDVLMLDNTRFMHGRTAILAPQERLIASYFGYLDFAEPDPEEPAGAIWRRQSFRPPVAGRVAA